MTGKRSVFIAALCGLALVGAGCGGDDDDNQALSYEETGTEIGKICDSVDFEDGGLTGEAKNDAEKLPPIIEDFEGAVQELRDLDVNEELEATRDEFAENADQQIDLIKEAQKIAEQGDDEAYRQAVEAVQPLDQESDQLASKLGAEACIN